MDEVKKQLASEKKDDSIYWFADSGMACMKPDKRVYLLPAFDEYTISYKDRATVLDDFGKKSTITTNGIFKPIIVINGRVEGLWKRTIMKNELVVETQLLELSPKLRNAK